MFNLLYTRAILCVNMPLSLSFKLVYNQCPYPSIFAHFFPRFATPQKSSTLIGRNTIDTEKLRRACTSKNTLTATVLAFYTHFQGLSYNFRTIYENIVVSIQTPNVFVESTGIVTGISVSVLPAVENVKGIHLLYLPMWRPGV